MVPWWCHSICINAMHSKYMFCTRNVALLCMERMKGRRERNREKEREREREYYCISSAPWGPITFSEGNKKKIEFFEQRTFENILKSKSELIIIFITELLSLRLLYLLTISETFVQMFPVL